MFPRVNASRPFVQALRALLIRADARSEGEHALVDELLRRGRCVLDVAGDHADRSALLDELERARLLVLQLVIADPDLEPATPDTTGCVDLRHLQLDGVERRCVVQRHVRRQSMAAPMMIGPRCCELP